MYTPSHFAVDDETALAFLESVRAADLRPKERPVEAQAGRGGAVDRLRRRQ
jgi:hypothetical protein